uniref:Cleavage stimulation factor subunit 2 n=1 Tax=Parasteatoda tepidariorum TaxID=114398 RepID=A0A2L2Y9X4_PARTP
MTAMQGALSAAERSMRSVFVGNIPYEATEEQLKDIFAEVGPVVSFRLVYDRETGKPKGYGFCEYKDQEMALSAMRNLNGYELNGRALRVDNAASEKSKEELKNLQASLGGPPVESPYGPEISGDQAPDAIAKIMSSLPPEQLYELMIQMKVCIENNPNEARILLMQNPQLCYALLQAQVIMKLVDPIQAKTMLHAQNPFTLSASALLPTPEGKTNATQAPTHSAFSTPQYLKNVPGINEGPQFAPAIPMDAPGSSPIPPNTAAGPQRPPPHNVSPARPSLLPAPAAGPNQYPDRGMNPRSLGDHDLRQMPMVDRDMRGPPVMGGDKDMRHQAVDEDFRGMGGPGRMPDNRYSNNPGMPHGDIRNMPSSDMRNMPPGDMRGRSAAHPGDMRNMPPGDMRNMPSNDMHRMPQSRGMPSHDPHPSAGGRNMPPMDSRNIPNPGGRNIPPVDARGMPMGDHGNRGPHFDRPMGPGRMDDHIPPMNPNAAAARPLQNPRLNAVGGNSPAVGGASPSPASSSRSNNQALAAAAAAIAPHDQEKAALIMQVLQLSDQQIAMLPPEQRQSILILKEQIARSTQAS